MNLTIQALATILSNDPLLSYAHASGYANADVGELIELDRFPFFNVICAPGNEEYKKTDEFIFTQIERHILPITIQYAVRFMAANYAVLGDGTNPGIAEFTKNIWTIIKKDRTLGRVVSGIVPGTPIIISPVKVVTNESAVFIEGREMTIQFYRDEEATPASITTT